MISGGLDTNIYPQCLRFSWVSSEKKRGGDDDQILTEQLCLGKETIYQKQGVIYANLSALTSSLCVSSHLWTALICNCSQRSITDSKKDMQPWEASAINASAAGETISHSWVSASSLLFKKVRTARANTGTLMNGVCHCERGRLGGTRGKFLRARCEFWVKNVREGGWGNVKQTAESSLENLIKMCNFCRCSLYFGHG